MEQDQEADQKAQGMEEVKVKDERGGKEWGKRKEGKKGTVEICVPLIKRK